MEHISEQARRRCDRVADMSQSQLFPHTQEKIGSQLRGDCRCAKWAAAETGRVLVSSGIRDSVSQEVTFASKAAVPTQTWCIPGLGLLYSLLLRLLTDCVFSLSPSEHFPHSSQPWPSPQLGRLDLSVRTARPFIAVTRVIGSTITSSLR